MGGSYLAQTGSTDMYSQKLRNKDIKNHVENETEKVLTCVLTMIGISIFELEGSKVSSVV